MNIYRFISVKLTFFLIVGILIGSHYDISRPIALTTALIFLGFLGFVFQTMKSRGTGMFGLLVALTTMSVGLVSYSLWQPKNQSDHYSHFVNDTTAILQLKIREELKSNSFQRRYIALVEEHNGQRTSGKIVLNLPIDSIQNTLQVDDEIIVLGHIKEINAPLNPHQFNYRQHMLHRGITYHIRGTRDSYFQSPTCRPTLFGYAAALRHTLISKLKKAGFEKDELGIIQALLLGQRNHISDETYDHYKDAGAVHILAVSGLHIGILLMLLQFLLHPIAWLPNGRLFKLITLITLLWCYALLSGMSPSVVRAVSMFSFVGYALYLNRPSNTFNILALSMFFILLLFNPMLLFQVGFQMSYAAVFSILWAYPFFQRFWSPKNRIVRKVWQLLSVSISAQIGVLPLSLFYFHQFPGLFFISNLIVVPFLGFLLGWGMILLILALGDVLPDFLAQGYGWSIETMNSVIASIAGFEAFVFRNIPFDRMQLMLAYSIILAFLLFITKTTFKRLVTLLLAVIGFQLWLIYITTATSRKQEVVLLHQNKNSILLHQTGHEITVHTAKPDKARIPNRSLMIARRIANSRYQRLNNTYCIENKKLLIVDSTGVIPKSGVVEYLLLTQSPKINLERIIDSLRPRQIIADGSNYRSAVKRWRETCLRRKLAFHDTAEQGAFYFN